MYKIHIAAEDGRLDTVKVLLDRGVNINGRDWRGETPLHCASWSGCIVLVKYLVERGADINAKDVCGDTAFSYACWNGHEEVVQYLLGMYEVDVQTRDCDGDSPLHDAVINNNISIIKLLLERGVDVEIENNYGSTPIDFASNGLIRQALLQYKQMHTLGEWRPWNHTQYPLQYRQAMSTLVLMAKSYC